MKQLIKYAALIFALVLSASIIGGCLLAGVSLVKGLYEEFSYPEELEGQDNNLWYRDDDGDVVFLGIHFGGSGEVKSGSETYIASDIESLDIEVGSGELIVEAWDSDSISVVYENIPEDYEILVDGKTLVIEREGGFVFWGVSFTETPKIHVSVPTNMNFNEIEVEKGSGSAKLIGISVEDLNVDSGSGGVNISDVTAEKSVLNSGSGSFIVKDSNIGEASMDTGSGFVNFENIVAKNLVLDTGSGRVDVSGYLTGNCVFESGSGSLNVVINGAEEAYNIRTDMGSGSFYLNGKKEKNTHIEHKGAENLLVFDAGSGRVSVEFKAETDTNNIGNETGENYDR